jgi:Protein of unknown function (DUF3791)
MIRLSEIQKFQLFCLENYKLRNKISGQNALEVFEKQGVFQFLENGFDVLHTQGINYILDEIYELINDKGQ